MFRSMLRRGALIAATAGLAATGFGTTPAQAAGPYGAGQVAGTVIFNGAGVPTVGCNDGLSFTFGSVVLNGSLSDGSRTFVGSINTAGVSGYSTTCAGATDSGIINDGATFHGDSPTGSASGGFSGTYSRVGSHTLVALTASVTVCQLGDCASYGGVPINLDASEFIPTKVNPANGEVQEASFVGEFHIGAGV